MAFGFMFLTLGSQRALIASIALLCSIVFFQTNLARAQEDDTGSGNPVASGPSVNDTVVGIDGHYRVGRWTAVAAPQSPTQPSGDDHPDGLSIETLDGDGVRVSYDQNLIAADQQGSAPSEMRFGYVVPGSEAAPLVVNQTGRRIESRFPGPWRPELWSRDDSVSDPLDRCDWRHVGDRGPLGHRKFSSDGQVLP